MTAVDADYGLLAREVLALATGGTLHVRGIDESHPGLADAVFYDDDGVPTFVVAGDSPLVAAARDRHRAVLAIPAGAATGFTLLVLGGHLAVRAAPGGPDGVAAVGLLVHTVVLERDAADSPTVGYRPVALAEWTAAAPDPLRPAAQRILAHANKAHGAQLREFVAGLRGIRAGDVLAADLAELNASGVQVRWVDARGAHRARLRFRHPAGCPGELAARLREVLHG